ncbi:hypothetical protein Taro_048414, partial [Colocasia esculenta]|nr:hypothetical protein [Colocasia esculenta]
LRKLHTTKSWDFLGLERGNGLVGLDSLWKKARYGEDIIIANIDTGVWPESASFGDEGMGPVPSRWKGYCEKVANPKDMVRCNRKLIGARHFSLGRPPTDQYSSARDFDGHGTHTLSTAGGSFVPGANLFGVANGTAKGGCPAARLAAYKVCTENGCYDADILAAFDAAIHDGPDVISVSLGGLGDGYLTNPISIGSFHAVSRGVAVVCSAGNDGPSPGTVSNAAPWVLTVAAGSAGRQFVARVSLGRKRHVEVRDSVPCRSLSLPVSHCSLPFLLLFFAVLIQVTHMTNLFLMPILRQGWSLASKHQPPRKYFPMINAAQAAASNAAPEEAKLCYAGSLDRRKVRGKIVVCVRGDSDRLAKAMEVYKAGGAGMIITNTGDYGEDLIADPYMIPAAHVGYAAAATIYSYLNCTGPHVGHIGAPKALYGLKPAPFVADFSSRGPNYISPEILKPDILAPGVDILAAFSQAVSPSEEEFDSRRVAFNILSGTSMSCPHVSGVVGLLKVLHPHWSPAALRSAIMTTARTRDNTGKAIKDSYSTKATPFDYGAGHIQPNRAVDPGLVYDLTDNDYLKFLCALGYNSSQLSKFAIRMFVCPRKHFHIKDLNYPSITVDNLRALTTVRRTLKNVSRPSTYIVQVKAPLGISVSVKPRILKFERRGEVKKFKITIAKKANAIKDYAFGQLIWSDGKHNVRSPLVVKTA